ncbi:hypothetical protein [Nocardia brasiliensis]|uniref:thiolase family protein n=1 Tax=Nocardia brasiliensis TaxID=37326 RepID=UPI00307C0BF2
MKRAAIVAPVRTPSGIEGGALAGMPPEWLASTVLAAVVEGSGIDPARVEDVALACVDGGLPAGPELSRAAARGAGLPLAVPGFLTDRRCGSGLQAVLTAAMMVQTGAADVVVAGGWSAPRRSALAPACRSTPLFWRMPRTWRATTASAGPTPTSSRWPVTARRRAPGGRASSPPR